MSTSTSSQQLLRLNSSLSRIDTDGNVVRPQPALLKLLRTAGAKGDTFTIKQVMHYLGQYIMVKQLYDKQQQHIVHCGTDELGELLGITNFSVKDPSPLYEMLKKNLYRVSHTDAAQISSRDQRQDSGGLEHHKNPDENKLVEMDETILSSSLRKRLAEDNENPAVCKQARLDLSFEEWDGAGLPWWFLGNLRSNYNPLSNGSTDIPSNQDIDTALVSDTTDDLWFLNENRSDQINVEVKMEHMESQDSEDEDVREDESKKVFELTIYEDDLEDTQSLSDDTDTDIGSEDCWQCTNCHKCNSPGKRYCFRCWALRKDWFADCPRLVHALSTPALPAKASSQETNNAVDIPDCRRTMSAPMVRGKGPESVSQFLEPLDLTSNIRSLSESTDTLFSCQSEETSLESTQPLLEPCTLCQQRPRNGNVVHGRTAHLVTCFHCARSLQKTRMGCPVCKKPIQMVVKTYVA
ncbi:PREDICTED: protein Mdm4 [Nanorana parkeri]|uniref:protein Mdm4 n=1 Tax=Nanorana parkeri TaxID=125878 RepID=UPI0008549163|nr:PREDICTED: protein Mdm4 [Nanorana parkeri]